MPYDAITMADWQISEAAEEKMKSLWQLQEEIGLQIDEVIPTGRVGRIDFSKVLERLGNKKDGNYIDVTACLLYTSPSPRDS